jgi:hypothetical protein
MCSKWTGASFGLLLVRDAGDIGYGEESRALLRRVYGLGYGVIHAMGTTQAAYDRSSFIHFLEGGWQGDPETAPNWYTGESPMIGHA